MSLAINAAPFHTDEAPIPLKSNVLKKKNNNNKTVKNRNEKISANNISNVLMNIHNKEDDEDNVGDFMPIQPPTSAGVEQTKLRDNSEQGPENPLHNSYYMDNGDNYSNEPVSVNADNMGKYRQFIPNYQKMYGNDVEIDQNLGIAHPNAFEGSSMSGHSTGHRDPIIEKLNHVINLLEEQQDDKTSHVTEEIVLYFLLGVFVIFIVDSFTRLGKYTR